MNKGNRRHLELGRRAEALAAAWAERRGWQIISRNYSCRLGELDIVALDKKENELTVIEVRYRTCGDTQSPVDSVGPKKLRALVNAGRAFVEKIDWTGPWRIDLLGITAAPGELETRWQVEYVKDITGGAFPV